MPITPKRIKEELLSCHNYFERRGRCVFCDVLRQESQGRSRVVAENESFLCFCPFASRAPFEMWVLPKKHLSDFARIDDGDVAQFSAILKESLLRLRALLDDPPFNFILHTAPYRNSSAASRWQSVESYYHWYLHISPRLTRSAGFEWGTGIHINPTSPEDAAYLLRQTQVTKQSSGGTDAPIS
jgi:UDPglucose--hexose-1-phosphate uridylyltransferase